jgi:hypothetical protein
MSQYENPPPPGGAGDPPPAAGYGAATGEAPKPVRQAVMLLFVLIAVGVINLIITLTQSDAPTVGGGVPGTLIFVALYTWLTLMIRNGKNWARIVITVLFLIGILLGLVGLAVAGVPAILKLVSAVQIAVQIAVLVLLFARASNEFFAARR